MRALIDIDSTEGTVQLHAQSEDGHLILHPTPNPNDPNDPLRWPRWKKHVCFGSVCAFTFLTNYAIGGLAPAFYILSLEFHRTQTETAALLLWPILVLGVFNFFWVPMGNYFGKRLIFVVASLLLSLCYLWGAVATTFESLLWSNIVAAFAGSCTEAVGVSTVNDLYFLHERANLMSFYLNAINGGNTLGPLICGFIVTSLSWRWHKWIAFMLTFINFLVVFFFCPETRYDRSGLLQVKSTQPSVNLTADPQAKSQDAPALEASEKTAEASEAEKDWSTASQEQQIPKKTWKQELSLWSGTPKNTTLFKLFIRPLPLIVYPAVILSFLGFAVSLAWVVAINILNPFVLQAPPYNWKPDIDGLINIAGFIGNVIGAFLGGWVVDKYSDWRSKKNGGVFVPETRLHLLVIPALIVPAGCLAFGYGVADTLNWTALFFGNGMVSLGLTFVPIATMTYVSDCYLPVNADALELVNGLKNIVAFGFLYGVVPWITTTGYVNAFGINTLGTQAGVYVLIMLLAIPVIVFGKQIRHKTARWRVILE